MKLFSSFHKKLVRRYLCVTAAIFCIFASLLYSFVVFLVYNSTLSKAHLLATEEAEELAYITSGSQPLTERSTRSEQSERYLSDIFYYMYDKDGNSIKQYNNLAWSQATLLATIDSHVLTNGKASIKLVVTPRNRLRMVVLARENAYRNGVLLGSVYAGFDCSRSMMLLGRLLLLTAVLLAVALLIAYKIASYLANKAMQPIIDSFTRQMQFASNASHELRTPLTVIMSGLDVLNDDKENHLSPFSQEIVADMKSEVFKMRHLIENLLLLARAGSSSLNINRQNVYILPLLNSTIEKFAAALAQKKLALEFLPEDSDGELTVYVDKTHLEQIIAILLDNAIKYTPEGQKITLAISHTDTTASLDVLNTGIGISSDDLPHIFDRFYRCSPTQYHEGSGLGLAIALTLTEKNNGSLLAKSDGSKLTEFILTLPQKK